jgi:hypothetical protein
MSDSPRPIGQIFVNLGRITPDDVDRALAFQQERGGFFGEALVKLGLLTPEEVRWGLADQHGLPFVQLRADQIDPAVARLVPPSWARQYLILPVLKDGDTVTAVVADPSSVRHFDQVRRFTGATTVEAAVCPVAHLTELINSVFAVERRATAALRSWLVGALAGGASRLGVSARRGRVSGWEEREGARSQTPLEEGWLSGLEEALVPFPEEIGSVPAERPAVIELAEGIWKVRSHWLSGGRSNLEWSATVERRILPDPRTAHADAALRDRFEATPAAGGRIGVCTASSVDDDLLSLAMATLPTQLFGDTVRSIHLAGADAPTLPGVLTHRLAEPAELPDAVVALATFAPDVLTVDVEGLVDADLDDLPDDAPLIIYRTARDAEPAGDCARLDEHKGFLVWTVA